MFCFWAAEWCFHFPSAADDGAAFVLRGAAPDFSATLVWTDPAGSPTAARALVNDLDLPVTVPPPLRTNRTRRVLHPVLTGHAASFTSY